MNRTETAAAFIKQGYPKLARQWQELIESRLKLIGPHFHSLPLGKIGDVTFPIYRTQNHGPYHAKLPPSAWSGNSEINYHTRGIYILDESQVRDQKVSTGKTGKMFLWGYVGDETFVYSGISFRPVLKKDEVGRDEEWYILRPIVVKFATARGLAKSPQREMFWEQLGEIVRYWHQNAEARLERTKAMIEMIQFEDDLLEASKFGK